MLKEIVCSKFKQGRIEFHKGLNVVLGDELGSNSIGKSTFLMIIDYVYGGKDYVMKSTDVQRNVGNQIIKFAFSFENRMYYFSRNTNDTEFVDVCDGQYNIIDRIPIEQYTGKLKRLYGFEEKEVKFRDVVGRYTRVYGKENLNEKRPLDVVHNEKAGQPINALLKLCGLYGAIQELEELAKEQVEKKIKEISEIPNLSRTILFKFAEIQKEIDELDCQNNYYDNSVILYKEKKDADSRKDLMRNQQLAQLQNMLNIEMAKLNNEIYDGEKTPPTISFNKNQYTFETVDDTGTGTCYRGVILLDLSIMKLTCLPILVHDSVLLKQIEDVAIEKILELYNVSEKQVFIALDKVWSYSERSQTILKNNRVLQLGTNGDELFGRSWSKK